MSNYEQHDDSIREENEHPQLVQDLHSLYNTHSADTQSLARIRSRLLQRASIPLPDKEDDNIITMQSLDTPEKHIGEITPLPTRRLNEWRNTRRHWPRLVSEIAALIIITALIGSIVLVFALRPHTPAHNGPLPSNPNGQIQQIHMIDAKVGWAVVQTKHGGNVDPAPAIMRTSDGGHTWYDVTPPESLNQWSTGVEVSQAPITNFLSANTAWIALVPLTADSASLYFTKDGGRTWQESTLPTVTFRDSITQMSFIDEQHGWLLTSSVAANPQYTEDTQNVTLFQTVDSGKTWLKVSESSASRPLSDTTHGPLPFEGAKTGFTFINAQTGWMVGQTQQAKFFWFYVTHDGGRTWQHQNLPQPVLSNSPTGRKPQFLLQPPVFFGSEGLITFTIPTDGNYPVAQSVASGEALEIYATHDSGATWHTISSTIAVASSGSFTGEAPQFEDATHGRVAFSNLLFLLHRATVNDGWIVTSYKANGPILQSNFVSPSTGWILAYAVQTNSFVVNPDVQLLLYQTTDGGQTWTQVSYSTMGQHVQTSQKLNAGWTAIASYSGTGSKVMFLHGQIAPSKQWGLVVNCSGTGTFTAILLDSGLLSNAGTGVGAKVGCPVEAATTDHNPQAIQVGGVQVQSDSGVTWDVLVVECTDSQGCDDSPIAK